MGQGFIARMLFLSCGFLGCAEADTNISGQLPLRSGGSSGQSGGQAMSGGAPLSGGVSSSGGVPAVESGGLLSGGAGAVLASGGTDQSGGVGATGGVATGGQQPADNCPSDPQKTEPGTCGCGRAESVGDADSDGVVDCLDPCPESSDNSVACFLAAPSNVDPDSLDLSGAPDALLDCGQVTVDTSGAEVSLQNWCGTAPQPVLVARSEGPDLAVIPLRGLAIPAGNSVRVVGDRPIVFVVAGDVDIAGTLDAGGQGSTPGPAGDLMCADSAGGAGSGDDADGGGGGGGGGHVTPGGGGGQGDGSTPGEGGAARAQASSAALQGGCAGGVGGGCSEPGGAGGGALQLSAAGVVRVSGTVTVNGGDGVRGCGSEGGGSGGGAGGSLLLQARHVDLSGGQATANGGRGGDGRSGGDGGAGSQSPSAAGGDGESDGANGGGGGGGGYGQRDIQAVEACVACD